MYQLLVASLSLPTISQNNIFGNNNQIIVNGDAAIDSSSPSPSPNSPSPSPSLTGACPSLQEPIETLRYPSSLLSKDIWGVYKYPIQYESEGDIKIFGDSDVHDPDDASTDPDSLYGVTADLLGSKRRYMPGAELCGYYKWALAKFASLYGTPDPVAIPANTTYAAELIKFEAKSLMENQTAVVTIIKTFSVILKIEEVIAKYGGNMKGHGSLYLSNWFFDPNMIIEDVKEEIGLSLWNKFDAAMNVAWPPTGHSIGGFYYNFFTHVAGAYSVLPVTGYTSTAISIMKDQGHTLNGFELTPFNGRLVPKYFDQCISAVHVHDYLHTFKVGDTSVLCSSRGAIAMNILIEILRFENELKDYEEVPPCETLKTKETMLEEIQVFYSTFHRLRKAAALGSWTMGTPVFDETDWARISELWMRPIEFHLKIINEFCGDPDFYKAHFPPVPFMEDDKVLRYASGNVTDMGEARKYGQCHAQWFKDDNCEQIHPDPPACSASIDRQFCADKNITLLR